MLIAPHVRGEELLAALAAPAHRAAELARGVAHQRVLGREPGFHAEAAADVAVDDTELLGFALEHRAQELARPGRGLVLCIERGARAVEDADARSEEHTSEL